MEEWKSLTVSDSAGVLWINHLLNTFCHIYLIMGGATLYSPHKYGI